jgi:hypothetical protein
MSTPSTVQAHGPLQGRWRWGQRWQTRIMVFLPRECCRSPDTISVADHMATQRWARDILTKEMWPYINIPLRVATKNIKVQFDI